MRKYTVVFTAGFMCGSHYQSLTHTQLVESDAESSELLKDIGQRYNIDPLSIVHIYDGWLQPIVDSDDEPNLFTVFYKIPTKWGAEHRMIHMSILSNDIKNVFKHCKDHLGISDHTIYHILPGHMTDLMVYEPACQ